MKRKITNKTQTAFTGKALTLAMALVMLIISAGFQTLEAQEKTRIVVEPDNFPLEIGALNRAIEANGGEVIYVLRNGKTYFTDRTLNYDHMLHFEAEEYPSNNPPVIRVGTNLLGQGRQLSNYRDNVIMRGIMFTGIDDLGGKQQNQRTGVQDIHLHYQHCYFMGAQNYMWQFYGIGTTLRLEDSFVTNHGRHTSVDNQRFIDIRGFDTDSLIVTNTSVSQLNFHIVRSGGAKINYLYFDHVTVVNHSMFSFDLTLVEDLTIKNSLFHDVALHGVWEAESVVGDAGPDYAGPRYVGTGGFIGITRYETAFSGVENPPLDSDRRFVIKNNNFGGLPPQEYLDLWEEMGEVTRESHPELGRRGSYPWVTDPAWLWANPDITPDNPIWATRDTIKVVRIWQVPLDSTLNAWAQNDEPWVTIRNNMREALTLNEMPPSMLAVVRNQFFDAGSTGAHLHYDRWDDMIANPDQRFYHYGDGNPVATTGPTAGWFRDFGYSSDTQSFTQGENGYPRRQPELLP
jgi:hypothetical protein